MSEQTLIALSREVAALTEECDRLKEQLAWEEKTSDETQRKLIDAGIKLKAKVQALEQAQTWQPIATAPKDGTPVLIFNLSGPRVVYWDATRASWHDGEYDFGATHWLPLPAPPAADRRPIEENT